MNYNIVTPEDVARREAKEQEAAVEAAKKAGAEDATAHAVVTAAGAAAAVARPAAAGGGAAVAAPVQHDEALDKLFKYIPSITVATYLAVQGVIAQVNDATTRKWVLLVVTLVLLAGTYLFLTQRNVQRTSQILASLGAFVVWVFALGGPFQAFWAGYETWMGSIALVLGAFLITAWNPKPYEEK